MRKVSSLLVGAVVTVGVLVGLVAGPADARDTNWPCAACVTTHP